MFYCKDILGKIKEKEERGQYFIGILLEGTSNWINNCLIPISQLDLSVQTEEAVSYGKEGKKEWEGESERHGMTQTDTGKEMELKGQCSRNR